MGLREGDEAVGWQEAWSEAVRLSADGTANGADGDQLSAFPDLPLLSEEAGADFDRIVRAKLANTTADEPTALNTTLKPMAPPLPSELSFNSLPKHAIASTELVDERRSCISDGVASFLSDSDNEAPLDKERNDIVGVTVGCSPPTDECSEAQRAVFAQHRAVTMKRLNRTPGRPLNNPQLYHNQSSTLAVPASTNDDMVSLSRSIQHSGSLNDIPYFDDGPNNLMETTLFEQVGLPPPHAIWSGCCLTKNCTLFAYCSLTTFDE